MEPLVTREGMPFAKKRKEIITRHNKRDDVYERGYQEVVDCCQKNLSVLPLVSIERMTFTKEKIRSKETATRETEVSRHSLL